MNFYTLWSISMLLLLNVYHVQVLGMKRSSITNFERYRHQSTEKKDAINLLDVWIAISLEVMNREFEKHVCSEDNDLKEAQGFVVNMMTESYLACQKILERCWDQCLHKIYKLSSKEFIDTVGIRYTIDSDYVNTIEQQGKMCIRLKVYCKRLLNCLGVISS